MDAGRAKLHQGPFGCMTSEHRHDRPGGGRFHGCTAPWGIESCVVALAAAVVIIMVLSRTDIEEALAGRRVDHPHVLRRAFHRSRARMAETGVISDAGECPGGRHGGQRLRHHAGAAVRLGRHLQLPGQYPVRGNDDSHPAGHAGRPAWTSTPLWWAVSLGACLGGNGTHHRRQRQRGAGRHLQEARATKSPSRSTSRRGFPLMLLTVAIAALYLVLRYPPA